MKSVGMTTGAFYGYYKSKEELFEAIVGEHYEYIRNRFIKAQQEFAELPAAQQPEVMSDISGICMYDILYYAYEHLEECKLILCCSCLLYTSFGRANSNDLPSWASALFSIFNTSFHNLCF